MPDAGTIAVTMGAGMLVNAAFDLQSGKSAAVPLLAGGAVMGVLIIVGSTTNEWELVEAVAVLFLVGSLFMHATKISGLNTLFTSKGGATSANTSSDTNPTKTGTQSA